MKLKLQAPSGSLNWLLVGEELEDRPDWSIFLLNHTPDSERGIFERAAKQASEENAVRLEAYRLRCKRGICSLEYVWNANTVAIKNHAARVAELLSLPLQIEDAPLPREVAIFIADLQQKDIC